MTTLDYTGINANAAKAISAKLSDLLANYQVFYTNVRGFHWGVEGKAFFTLHAKFESIYNDLAGKVDEIAERILMLGGVPENRFSEYLKTSSIKEIAGVKCGGDALVNILDSYKVIVAKQRELLALTDEHGDEVTNALMSGYLQGQEKDIWMYVAFLTKGSCGCDSKK